MQLETVTVYLAKTGEPVKINRVDYEQWAKAGKSPEGKFVSKVTPKPVHKPVELTKPKAVFKRTGYGE
jgi:hypothetical protein